MTLPMLTYKSKTLELYSFQLTATEGLRDVIGRGL